METVSISRSVCLFFFFFQAEDGIRDWSVTGVQTCALPISFAHKGGVHVSAVSRHAATYEHIDPSIVGNARRILVSELSGKSNVLMKSKALRSEERRVGKECRSRWSPYH